MLRVGAKVMVRDGELIFEGEILRVSAHEDVWYYIDPTIGFIKKAGGTQWYHESKVSPLKNI